MTIEILIVFFVTLLVRLWSTLVGGGGSIMIPMLLFMGLPPAAAIATNRFSGASNMLTIIKFNQLGLVKWKLGLFLAIFSGLGAGIGSFFVLTLDNAIMEKGIGVILILSVPMLLLKGKLGLEERNVKITKLRNAGGALMMTILGAIGGFFSSTGVWFSYVFLYYYGLSFLQTAGTRKLSGAAIVLVSLSMFIPAGLVVWPIALSMFVGGGIGGWIGAKYSKQLGNKWIRNIFAVVVLGSALRILLF